MNLYTKKLGDRTRRALRVANTPVSSVGYTYSLLIRQPTISFQTDDNQSGTSYTIELTDDDIQAIIAAHVSHADLFQKAKPGSRTKGMENETHTKTT